MDEYMLTTKDNPYDPFTQYDDWYAYDASMGYHTPGLLARVTYSSDELSDSDQELAINNAIQEIIEENILGIYTKAFRKR